MTVMLLTSKVGDDCHNFFITCILYQLSTRNKTTYFSVVFTESKIAARGKTLAIEERSLALKPHRATFNSDNNSLLVSLTAILSTVTRNQSIFAAILSSLKTEIFRVERRETNHADWCIFCQSFVDNNNRMK